MQTAIIIKLPADYVRGDEILIRLNDVHVPSSRIVIDDRPIGCRSWAPISRDALEVRCE